MSDTTGMVISLLTGLLLGLLFFGGLWWTVQRILTARHPVALVMGSLLLRLGTVIIGMVVVAHDHWVRFVVCLLGLVIARVVVTRLTRLPEGSGLITKEEDHAS
ncbi:MAG: N-ATPase subunit AtpR [Armatimonadota bacterium]